jgi:hypothetical protein
MKTATILALILTAVLSSVSHAQCVTCHTRDGESFCKAGTVAELCQTTLEGCTFSGHRNCGRGDDDVPHQSRNSIPTVERPSRDLESHDPSFEMVVSTVRSDAPMKDSVETAKPVN